MTASKVCCRCGIEKWLAEFSKNKLHPGGLSRQCRACVKYYRDRVLAKDPERIREANKKSSRRYSERYPERRIEATMRFKYGIGLSEYAAMLERQGGGCAICGAPPYRKGNGKRDVLCIDHCHAAGTVRGLLCDNCNKGIGCFSDDPDTLERAANYLKSQRALRELGAA